MKKMCYCQEREQTMPNNKSEYRNSWIAEKLDRVNLTMPKGRKERVKAHAEARGESVNAFINRAITETMERETPDKAEQGGAE